jgi:hypothetical protein
MARLELMIELDPNANATDEDVISDATHVRGTVRHADGAEAPFVGWLSLMAVLQAAVVDPAGGAGGRGAQT